MLEYHVEKSLELSKESFLVSKIKKTRKLKDASDWICPVHKTIVKSVVKKIRKEDGTYKYGGQYYRCSIYKECGYYVSLNYDIPILE